MAQAILVQEQALANMQTRVQELERQLAERPAGGGFLSGLFGGGPQQMAPAPQQPVAPVDEGMTPPRTGAGYGSPWGARPGGGFLAGAMQTTLGVAGGVLVADALSNEPVVGGIALGARQRAVLDELCRAALGQADTFIGQFRVTRHPLATRRERLQQAGQDAPARIGTRA
jgi:hypothetical protein